MGRLDGLAHHVPLTLAQGGRDFGSSSGAPEAMKSAEEDFGRGERHE